MRLTKNGALGLLAVLLVSASLAVVVSCGEGDGVNFDDGKLTGAVTLPLLPFDLPIFPTDITLEGLAEDAYDYVDDELGFLNPFDEDDVEKALGKNRGRAQGSVAGNSSSPASCRWPCRIRSRIPSTSLSR
ncbi:MAG: hypothetical protein M5R36_03330 [Deltaproteobacteria bacterium]|nr:hypothetical protein [Deltaproteobacteria bacterium]